MEGHTEMTFQQRSESKQNMQIMLQVEEKQGQGLQDRSGPGMFKGQWGSHREKQ